MDRVGEQEETGGLESTRNTPRGLPLQNGNLCLNCLLGED